jgi:hypothetical protein
MNGNMKNDNNCESVEKELRREEASLIGFAED